MQVYGGLECHRSAQQAKRGLAGLATKWKTAKTCENMQEYQSPLLTNTEDTAGEARIRGAV